jgi:hypothetical protein
LGVFWRRFGLLDRFAFVLCNTPRSSSSSTKACCCRLASLRRRLDNRLFSPRCA